MISCKDLRDSFMDIAEDIADKEELQIEEILSKEIIRGSRYIEYKASKAAVADILTKRLKKLGYKVKRSFYADMKIYGWYSCFWSIY